MNSVFISIIILTVLQRVICGFSWLMFFSYLGRVIFLTRIIGAVVNYKVSLVLEGIHLGFIALGIIMSGFPSNWVQVLLDVVCCLVVALLIVIDNAYYLYVVEDDESDSEEE